MAGHVGGSAQRRRDRWVRSWHRHEQQSICCALATSLHHSVQRPSLCPAETLALCAWYRVISRVLPPFLHVCRVVVFRWVLLRMQVPLMVRAHLFFFHLSLVLNPRTRNLFGSSSCARFWKERLRNLRLRLTRMFVVFPCQALRRVCRVLMSATFPVLPTSVGLGIFFKGAAIGVICALLHTLVMSSTVMLARVRWSWYWRLMRMGHLEVWTVYEMANRRGPGAVFKYWAWYGGSGFGWPPRRTGGRSGLLGHCWHLASPRRFVFSFVHGSASGYSFAFGAVRGGGSSSSVALCAGSTSPSCLCVGTGLGCRSTSSGSVASACCWTVCSGPGVASFCEGSFFLCRDTVLCLSAVRSVSFVIFCSQQIVSGCSHALLVRGAFEVEPSKVSVTSPSEPVSIGVVRASWLGFWGGGRVRACGFVSRSFRCWGFLASFQLCGLPCLVHVPVPS